MHLYKNLDDTVEREYILAFLCIPTAASIIVMIFFLPSLRRNHELKSGSASGILCILLFSIPSPVFLHLYYLYLVARNSIVSRKCRLISKICLVMQLGRAISGSLPLFIFGINILTRRMLLKQHINQLEINELSHFMNENLMYLLSMLLSLFMLVISVHRYNERLTGSILSVLVTVPYTASTVAIRSIALALILSIYPISWSCVLVTSLVLGLLLVNLVGQISDKTEDEESEVSCWKWLGHVVYKLPGKIVKACVSIISPVEYNNDRLLSDTASHGSVLILLNYLLVMVGLCVGVATAVLYWVPNNYTGLIMSGMRGWTIHVPEMPVIMKTDLGMEFRVKTQPKEMDLASAMNIDIITDESLDMIVSIALPGLMVLLTLPITLTRLALLGMECYLIKRDKYRHETITETTDDEDQTLEDSISAARQGVAGRLSVSLCCGLLATVITSIILLLATVALALRLFKTQT